MLVGPDEAVRVLVNAVARAFAAPDWANVANRNDRVHRELLAEAAARPGGRDVDPLVDLDVSIDAHLTLARVSAAQRAALFLARHRHLALPAVAVCIGSEPGRVRRDIAQARRELRRSLGRRDLDGRIDDLLRSAAADAPLPPPVPSEHARVDELPATPRRRRAIPIVGAIVVTAAIAATVWGSLRPQPEGVMATPTTERHAVPVQPSPTGGLPDGLSVVVATGTTVVRVDGATTTQLIPGNGIIRAFMTADGTVIYQTGSTGRPLLVVRPPDGPLHTLAGRSALEDVRADGTIVYSTRRSGDVTVHDSAEPLPYVLPRATPNRVHAGPSYVLVQADYPEPSTLAVLGAERAATWPFPGVGGGYPRGCVCPRLYTVSYDGARFAYVDGDYLVVSYREHVQVEYRIPDGERVVDVDLGPDAAVINRAKGPATVIDLATFATYELPIDGFATLPRV